MAQTTSTLFIQEFMKNFHYSRRLLLEATVAPPPAAKISHDTTDLVSLSNNVNTFDANVIMVLAVLVFALICSLVFNSIIKCAFRCSSLILADSFSNHRNPSAAKLANTGIKKKALNTFQIITYTTELKYPGVGTECVICLSEFGVGEKVKVLPKCNHGFHVKCIGKWLNSHSSCPTCRHCLIETCQKIVNGDSFVATTVIPNTSNTSSAPVLQEIVIRIEPLQREGVIINNQN
ncbi:PREDICTED: RING-H2 finger protein ATL78-like [Nicotiana attenuata]|uniref:RING-type E3 ubiquitin transferase n=1 Tax=Nicotiana attenuata TaxID=49451 RepID=A0A314KMU8_NICAT|nr:PREDICTED: RING-H2 finger protein ATL78-like [Nicotiana attenuata]OIT30515.1 ring-h2 finger protein atl78 [Nicotiana attenuata]